jgi:hypothetical protein
MVLQRTDHEASFYRPGKHVHYNGMVMQVVQVVSFSIHVSLPHPPLQRRIQNCTIGQSLPRATNKILTLLKQLAAQQSVGLVHGPPMAEQRFSRGFDHRSEREDGRDEFHDGSMMGRLRE